MPNLRHLSKRLQELVGPTGHLSEEERLDQEKLGIHTQPCTNALSVDSSGQQTILKNVGIFELKTYQWMKKSSEGIIDMITISMSKRPLSERLQERLERLDKLDSKPSMLFCKRCESYKPNRMPYFRPGRSKCRACERRIR